MSVFAALFPEEATETSLEGICKAWVRKSVVLYSNPTARIKL